METRALEGRIESMRRRLKFNYKFCVEAQGLSGGLGLLWNDEVHIQVFEASQNYIHASVLVKDIGKEFDCTYVYGNPNFQQRRGLWSKLLALQGERDIPWCCMGDFNELLSQYEKEGIRPYHSGRGDLFRDFLNIYGLMELDLKGCHFTWASNPRNGVIIREKLDCILVNCAWRREFPHGLAVALPSISSDHSILLLLPEPRHKCGQSFNFEAFWVEHEECGQVVDEGWHKGGNQVDPWANIKEKMENCKKELVSWQKKTFKKNDEEIQVLKKKLENLMSQEGQLANGGQILEIQKKIDEAWRREELY